MSHQNLHLRQELISKILKDLILTKFILNLLEKLLIFDEGYDALILFNQLRNDTIVLLQPYRQELR